MKLAAKTRQASLILTCALALGVGCASVVRAQTQPQSTLEPASGTDGSQAQTVALVRPESEGPSVDPDSDPFVKLNAVDTQVLFDFGRSVLRPAGRVALDRFVKQIRGFDAWLILLVGYTDRLETGPSQQRLAERRAASIRTYLLAKGVEPSLIHIQTRAAAGPDTKTAECLGPRSSQVIGCLEPDRRVEVEMVGVAAAR